jgi:hypothetical protein
MEETRKVGPELKTTLSGSMENRSVRLATVSLLLVLVASGCLCGNDKYEHSVSPQGTFKITKYRRSCGATTPFYTTVQLRRQSVFPWRRQSKTVLSIREDQYVEIEWNEDTAVTLRFTGTDVSAQEPTHLGVTLNYERLDRREPDGDKTNNVLQLTV